MFHVSGFLDEVSGKLDVQLSTANELNMRFFCPRKLDGSNIADYTPEAFAQRIGPRLQQAGLRISSLGSPIGKIKLEDDTAYQAQLKKLAALIDIAEASGTKYIRIFSFYVKPDFDEEAAFPLVTEGLRGFLEVARGRNVVLLHENEKGIFGSTPARCMRIYTALNDPQLRLCYDASNYIQCGCDAWEAYQLTREATDYYHMKDCLEGFEIPLGQGQGRIKEILADLSARGYDGFLTLEPHLHKYVLLRGLLHTFPFLSRKGAQACRIADEKSGLTHKDRLSLKDAFCLQYNNLTNLIKEAGGQNQYE